MDYAKDIDKLTDSTSTWSACPHDKGWYFSVRFYFWTLRLYWCDLCHKPFKAKFMKVLLKSRTKEE